MAKTSRTPKKGGRPSVNQQKEIQKKIRAYFDNNYSAAHTARETGYNVNTVKQYFREWVEAIASDATFLEQQHEAKTRLVLALDDRIKLYNQQIKRVEEQIQHKSSIALETLLAQLNKYLSTLLLDKAGVLITPTVDVQIESILKEKHGIDLQKIKEQMNAHGR